MRVLLTLLLVASPPGMPPGASVNAVPGAPPATADSVTTNLQALARWSTRGPVLDADKVRECSRILGDLDRSWVHGTGRSDQIQLAYLDFLGRCLRIATELALESPPHLQKENSETDLRRRATAILRRRLPESRRFLTLEVLIGRVDGESHPLDRRLAACEVLASDQGPETVLALLTCTRPTPPATEAPAELVDAAIAALSGRDLEVVHLRLLDLLKRAENGLEILWKGEIEAHFRSISLQADQGRSPREVHSYVSEALHDKRWRRASRAISVAHCLPNSLAFPLLIEALGVWLERSADGQQPVRRIQGEILAELKRRSGRSLGAHPERWTALWQGHLNGEISLSEDGQLPEGMTVSGFFGLRPETDRVTFVLDHSGSMEAEFGDKRGHTRLDEAADQLAALLGQLGPRTQFNVVTFSDAARSWQRELQPAEAKAIANARKWVCARSPRGGTRLRAGVWESMGLDKNGRIDLEDLEVDTIIVLCDGFTAEGPSWVEPFLHSVNDEARVVFYAVQLGSGGDGTLEALCEQTGGQFLLVEG